MGQTYLVRDGGTNVHDEKHSANPTMTTDDLEREVNAKIHKNQLRLQKCLSIFLTFHNLYFMTLTEKIHYNLM